MEMVESSRDRPRLAVIIVSANSAHWLPACLDSLFARAGALELDVIVVDSDSTDDTIEVAGRYSGVRVLSCKNLGFAHANNRALAELASTWVLFLNPDTELLEGTLEELVRLVEARPSVGLVGVRQVTPDGALFPTMRRFPTPLRMACEALASEQWPVHPSWAGERVLDMARYEDETTCDWVSGSFMLARREAIQSAGFMDERFFLFSEEVDFCLRIRRAGWEIRHMPQLTILHHFGKAGVDERLVAQEAYARLLYMSKHFSRLGQITGTTALALGHALRAATGGRDGNPARRAAARTALATLTGRVPPPFGEPPAQAVPPRPAP